MYSFSKTPVYLVKDIELNGSKWSGPGVEAGAPVPVDCGVH